MKARKWPNSQTHKQNVKPASAKCLYPLGSLFQSKQSPVDITRLREYILSPNACPSNLGVQGSWLPICYFPSCSSLEIGFEAWGLWKGGYPDPNCFLVFVLRPSTEATYSPICPTYKSKANNNNVKMFTKQTMLLLFHPPFLPSTTIG